MRRLVFFWVALIMALLACRSSFAQDKRTQFNGFLSKGYFSFNPGYINYPFNEKHLYGGWKIKSITIPHFGARIMLGIQINKNIAAEYSVMRAALWPYYWVYDAAGDLVKKNVWVNEWGLTLKARVPLLKKNFIFLEGGVGLVSRNGFGSQNTPEIKDANYVTFLGGGGLQRSLGTHWDVQYSVSYSPPNPSVNQPYSMLNSLGFTYRLGILSDEKVKRNNSANYIFPRHFIQVGGASDVVGFMANNLFSVSSDFKGIPIFWRGEVEVKGGFAINYQRNIFHGRKRFSMDWGASLSGWQSGITDDQFMTMSVFPVLRYWFVRSKPLDVYAVYAIVGPTYISKVNLDGRNTGTHFTYQDFLGIGGFLGKNRKTNIEVKIEHYSNGNIFTDNPGVDIPLMLNVGRAF